jgi:hypothetical protein
MRKRLVAPEVVLVVLIFSPFMRCQTPQPQSGAEKGQKAAPAATAIVDVDDWGNPVTAPRKGQKSAWLRGMTFLEFGTQVSTHSQCLAYSARVQYRKMASQNMSYPTLLWGGKH